MDKRTLRASARAARALVVHTAIPVPHAYRALLRPGMVITSYIPLADEADPTPLAQAALAAGCEIALPYVVDRATPMRFLAWDGTSPLVPGPFGLRQPPAIAPERTPDLILTPLVAFDAALNRIGQGAGYYDRAFARFPGARRVGVAYAAQQVAAIEPDPWDVPLHAIATEQDWLTR